SRLRRVARWSDEDGARAARALPPLPLELAPPSPVEVALQARETVEEELTLQMIDLVLQRDREELLAFDLDLPLLGRPRAHGDGAARCLRSESGYASIGRRAMATGGRPIAIHNMLYGSTSTASRTRERLSAGPLAAASRASARSARTSGARRRICQRYRPRTRSTGGGAGPSTASSASWKLLAWRRSRAASSRAACSTLASSRPSRRMFTRRAKGG